MNAAAKLPEPNAQHVSLSGATIKNDAELSIGLTTAEEAIRAKLKDGRVIVSRGSCWRLVDRRGRLFLVAAFVEFRSNSTNES